SRPPVAHRAACAVQKQDLAANPGSASGRLLDATPALTASGSVGQSDLTTNLSVCWRDPSPTRVTHPRTHNRRFCRGRSKFLHPTGALRSKAPMPRTRRFSDQPFGPTIQRLMEERERSYRDLAHETGLSARYLNHLVHGNRPVPSDDVIATLAQALGAEADH